MTRILIMVILCLLVLLVWQAHGNDNPCWPCYDCLSDCERGDGKECCVEAKKECCKDCRFTNRQYCACLRRVDSEESYLEHRTKRKVNEYRQRFLDELEDSMPTQ